MSPRPSAGVLAVTVPWFRHRCYVLGTCAPGRTGSAAAGTSQSQETPPSAGGTERLAVEALGPSVWYQMSPSPHVALSLR